MAALAAVTPESMERRVIWFIMSSLKIKRLGFTTCWRRTAWIIRPQRWHPDVAAGTHRSLCGKSLPQRGIPAEAKRKMPNDPNHLSFRIPCETLLGLPSYLVGRLFVIRI